VSEQTMDETLRAERLEAEQVVAHGTVKWLCAGKLHGLIDADEGDADLPFQAESVVSGCLDELAVGTRVEFVVDEGLHGLEAFRVTLL
jgi:cold shock CspA family protein